MTEIGETSSESFEKAKTKFFAALGLKVKNAFQMHKEMGLWKRVEGKRVWENVSEHCLVETARAEVFSQLLGLSDGLGKDLRLAAALHDFFKKDEVEIVKSSPTWEKFDQADRQEREIIRGAGFSDRVEKLVSCVGSSALLEIQELQKLPEFSEDDLACLVMEYLDDYTFNGEWANPVVAKDGQKLNEVDRRVDKNEANPMYQLLNEEGKGYFGGETTFQAQRRIAHRSEEILAREINQRNSLEIDPKDLPQFIDEKIKQKILSKV
jgi:hypothetical protein